MLPHLYFKIITIIIEKENLLTCSYIRLLHSSLADDSNVSSFILDAVDDAVVESSILNDVEDADKVRSVLIGINANAMQFCTCVCKKLFHVYLKKRSINTFIVPSLAISFLISIDWLQYNNADSNRVICKRVLPNGGSNTPIVVWIGAF